MKLTKKARDDLRFVLRNAERAHIYISSPNIAVARKGGPATTTLHYTRADGSALYEVDKEIGSDLTGLKSAIAALATFIALH